MKENPPKEYLKVSRLDRMIFCNPVKVVLAELIIRSDAKIIKNGE